MAALTLLSWMLLVGAIVFALLFLLTFWQHSDGESDDEEPTLNTRNDRDP